MIRGHQVRQEQCKPIASADFLPRALTTSATAVSDNTRPATSKTSLDSGCHVNGLVDVEDRKTKSPKTFLTTQVAFYPKH